MKEGSFQHYIYVFNTIFNNPINAVLSEQVELFEKSELFE